MRRLRTRARQPHVRATAAVHTRGVCARPCRCLPGRHVAGTWRWQAAGCGLQVGGSTRTGALAGGGLFLIIFFFTVPSPLLGTLAGLTTIDTARASRSLRSCASTRCVACGVRGGAPRQRSRVHAQGGGGGPRQAWAYALAKGVTEGTCSASEPRISASFCSAWVWCPSSMCSAHACAGTTPHTLHACLGMLTSPARRPAPRVASGAPAGVAPVCLPCACHKSAPGALDCLGRQAGRAVPQQQKGQHAQRSVPASVPVSCEGLPRAACAGVPWPATRRGDEKGGRRASSLLEALRGKRFRAQLSTPGRGREGGLLLCYKGAVRCPVVCHLTPAQQTKPFPQFAQFSR